MAPVTVQAAANANANKIIIQLFAWIGAILWSAYKGLALGIAPWSTAESGLAARRHRSVVELFRRFPMLQVLIYNAAIKTRSPLQ
jgi:hypothetical protein